MKLETSFDNGKTWDKSIFQKEMVIDDFIDWLSSRGRTHYRIDNGPAKKIENKNFRPQILRPEICSQCGRISMAAELKGKIICVYCVYNPEEEKEEPGIPGNPWDEYLNE